MSDEHPKQRKEDRGNAPLPYAPVCRQKPIRNMTAVECAKDLMIFMRLLVHHGHRNGSTEAWKHLSAAADTIASELAKVYFAKPDLLDFAKQRETWPVSLSSKTEYVVGAVEMLESLGVGTQSAFPTHRATRIERGNYWTQVAYALIDALEIYRALFAKQKAQSRNGKTVPIDTAFDPIAAKVLESYLPAPSEMKACGDLPVLVFPASDEIAAAWWQLGRRLLKVRWRRDREFYLRCIDHDTQAAEGKDKREGVRRNFAAKKIGQAFRRILKAPRRNP